jgi:hypothetical protein
MIDFTVEMQCEFNDACYLFQDEAKSDDYEISDNYEFDDHGFRNLAFLYKWEDKSKLNLLISEDRYIPSFYKSLIYGFNERYNEFVEKIESLTMTPELKKLQIFNDGSLASQQNFEFKIQFVLDYDVNTEFLYPFLDLFTAGRERDFKDLSQVLAANDEYCTELEFFLPAKTINNDQEVEIYY